MFLQMFLFTRSSFTLLKQTRNSGSVWYWNRPRDFPGRRVDTEVMVSRCRTFRVCIL